LHDAAGLEIDLADARILFINLSHPSSTSACNAATSAGFRCA
jgi:hypothetical protein